MTEGMFYKKFEMKEEIKEAETEYLRKRGIKRVGHRKIFDIKETKDGIEICGGSAMRYYFDDKEEAPPSSRACVSLPKEFLPELKKILEELQGNKPKWVGSRKKKE